MKRLALLASVLAAVAWGEEAAMRIGVIGCDTSHTIAFTEMMNRKCDPDCAGFKVTAAYQWGSRDIVSSTNRYPKYIPQMEAMGVKMVPSIADLLKEVDAVLLETNDGRPHLEQAKEVFASGKPVFIDKPVTATLADAVKLVEAGKAAHAKWFCSSSLRYVKNAQKARNGAFGPIRGATCWSPEQFEPTQSEFFWYAIHAAEPLFTIMGTGCAEVRCTGTATEDVAVGTWKDGRLGIMRAFNYKRKGCGYGGSIHSEHYGFVDMGTYEGYKPLLVEILKFFRTGVVPVSPEETLEIYAFLEAATQSKAKGGAAVTLAEVLAKARAE
ncbi:MAG: Gfo/Idh/MocA family oxidoreductase [Kiritimatiellae bacterium]|nr:Gfo/Idh/MocA family oxidoreductase [Kiritimatiellia bacterium]